MKARTLIFCAVALVLGAACKKESTPEITPTLTVSGLTGNEISVSSDGGTATFTVTSNVDWSASTDADWFFIDPSSAKNSDGKDKTTTVTVKVNPSKDGKARSGEFSISADKVNLTPVKVTVKQAEKIEVIFTTDVKEIASSSDGGEFTIKVTANNSWAFNSVNSNWITVEPQSKEIALGTKTETDVKVTIAKNETIESRTEKLIIKCDGAKNIEIAVSQEPGVCSITVWDENVTTEVKEVSFPFSGDYKNLTIDTDAAAEPEISISVPWIAWVTVEEFVPGEYWHGTIVADTNTATEAREGTITFKVKGNEAVVTVKQAKGASVSLSVDNITYQSADLTITPSEGDFTYYTTLLKESYYKQLVGKGLSDADILYEIAAGNAEYYSMDLPTYLGYVLKQGEYTYAYVELDPETNFTAVCGGMTSEGVVSTDCKTLNFTTTAKPAADAAYTELLGTWKVKGNSATYNEETKSFEYGVDDICWTGTVEECVVNESYYISFQNSADKVCPISGSYFDRFYMDYLPSNDGKAGFGWYVELPGDMGYAWSFKGISEYCCIAWIAFDKTSLNSIEQESITITWDAEKNAMVPTDPAAGTFIMTTGVFGESGEYYGYYSGYAEIMSLEQESAPATKSSAKKASSSIMKSKDEIKAFAPKKKFNCVERIPSNFRIK